MIRLAIALICPLGILITSAALGGPAAYRPATSYDQFAIAAGRLLNVATRHDAGTVPLDSVRLAVRRTRHAYKRVEFALVQAFPAFAKTEFNAAPIPRVVRAGNRSFQEAPTGLQVLDELVNTDSPDPNELVALANELAVQIGELRPAVAALALGPEVLAEAAQTAVVSAVTLSLTGYDTPGSLDGVGEAATVLSALAEAYEQLDVGEDDLVAQLRAAAAALDDSDGFAAFDRVGFVRRHADPLYRALGARVDPAGWTGSQPSARVADATGVFAPDFLDVYAYTRLTPTRDSDALRALGARLFADPRLSEGGELSCASCHDPDLAYTDGRATSLDAGDGSTAARNAPTLLGAALADRYFYDLRAFTLEQQAEHVIFAGEEFASDYSRVLARLVADSVYPAGFAEAFPNESQPMSRSNLGAALASFVASLSPAVTRFDAYMLGRPGVELSASELAGANLFLGKAACATCHFAPTFSGLVPPYYLENESEVLGVPTEPGGRQLDGDLGRAASTVSTDDVPAYRYSFKTATVRMAARTGPYFHHGTYHTLDDVLDFYNRGGGVGLGLDVPNQTLSPDPLELTQAELLALESFLRALSEPAG